MRVSVIGGRLVAGGGFDAGEVTIRAVPAQGIDVELPLNADGIIDMAVNLPMVDPYTRKRVDLANLLVPGRDFIGVVVDDTIVEAGPIWGDPFSFPKNGRIVAQGLWSYFNSRFVLPPLSAGQLPRDVTSKWVDLSLRTIAKRLVQQACSHPNSGLPIDYEPDFTGTHEREFPGSDLKSVGDALSDLTQVEGGPDITFRPKWGADRKHVRWDLLTGDSELKQAGADHYWDASVPEPHARIDSFDRDGSELTTRDFELGATLRNLHPNSSLADELGEWLAGGANGTLIRATGHTASPVPGVTTGTFTSWTGPSGSGNGGAWYPGTATAGITVEPGKVYRVSTWARANVSKPVALSTQVYDDESTVISGGTAIATATLPANTWVLVTGTFTTPADAAKMGPFLYPQAGQQWAAGNHLYTLGWMITEGISTPPYSRTDIQIQAIAADASLTSAGFPLLESMTNRSSVTLDTTLQNYANEAVVRGSAHVETFTILARRAKHPKLGTYWPGDYATVNIGPNPRIPAGKHRVRIVGLSFSKTGDVAIQCAPERIVSGYPIPSTNKTWFRDKLAALTAAISEVNRGK